ncbi:hypothetical protein V1514DRAFT_349629 [Lipomyces japonicus]|uniref:uncharacterized protein n=1 Tax=Lipomyces japonicus TaxID=56871 RepID=UPI0034CD73D9
MPDIIDGDIYIRNLAAFIRANERQLASVKRLKDSNSLLPSSLQGLSSSTTKNTRLSLTPHHLLYLLRRFKELGLHVGSLAVRLETIQSGASHSSYVSFLHDSLNGNKISADRKSLQSTASMRSTMSGVSAIFDLLSSGSKEKAAKVAEENLTYIYSSFTKIPALRLSHDQKAKIIEGFEQFPFDRAVPIVIFKNLTSLELVDVDVRAFFGWNVVAERLRTLIIKHGQLDDPMELLHDLVLDDMDKRRNRTSTDIPVYSTQGESLEGLESPQLPSILFARATSRNSSRSRRQSESSSTARTRSVSRSPVNGRPGRSGSLSSTISTLSTGDSPPRTTLDSLHWSQLRHLSLEENGISSVANEAMIPLANSLITLDLTRNLLISIPEALSQLSSLASLNLSFNLISSLHSLTHHPLPAITVLNLRGNNIVSLAGLDRIVSIERIDLRDNKLSDPTEIARLTGAPNLTELWVAGNPFVKTHSSSYRVTIFNLFRTTAGYSDDVLLDGTNPGLLEQRQLVERVEESVPALNTQRSTFLGSVPVVEVKDDTSDILPALKNSFNNLFKNSTADKISNDMSPPVIRQKSQEDGSVIGSQTLRLPSRFSRPNSSSGNRSRPTSKSRTSSHSRGVSPTPSSDSGLAQPAAIKSQGMTILNPSANSKPKKIKQTRRRVIDLDGPIEYNDVDDKLSTYTGSSVGALSTSDVRSPMSMSPPPLPPDNNDLTSQGEEYRKRIEALRNDFGSGWLSVLSEEL